jgi:signal transduction histidine kinase/ActR/RegA family two-component response regulator
MPTKSTKNERTLFFICVVLAMSCQLFAFMYTLRIKDRETEILLRETRLTIDSIAISHCDHLKILRAVAEGYLYTESSSFSDVKARLFDVIGKGWELKPSEADATTSLGRITGLGGVAELSPNVIKEIAMLESILCIFDATKANLPRSPFVYYFSKNNLISLYPRDMGEFAFFDKKYHKYELYTAALPENNKTHGLYWTKPYMDAGGNGLVVTVGIPLYYKDEFMGGICLDMTFKDIAAYMKNPMFAKKHVSLVDNHNQVVSSTIPELVPTKDQPTLNQLLDDKESSINQLATEQYFWYNNNRIFVSPLSTAPWYVIHKEPLSDLLVSLAVRTSPLVAVLFFCLILIKSLLRNRRLRVENQIAKEKAEIANAAKSEFLANISHEIRTPMNAILGFTEIIKESERDGKKVGYINIIQQSGQALLNLINDVLDLSKIEAGKTELQYKPASIRSLFQEMKTVFSQKIAEKGLDFIVSCDQSIPATLFLDEPHLRQVIINLVSNAIKFTQTGWIRVSAMATDYETPDDGKITLVIEVVDSGIGISKEEHDKIFDAFEQIKSHESAKHEGTGLGLAISNRLIQMMGGSIAVKSGLEKGTSFTVTIPGVVITSEEAGINTTENSLNYPSIIFKHSKILVADDIEYNREMIKIFLAGWDFETRFCQNGKEVTEEVKVFKPDLILMDMKMPVMDGYEASMMMHNDSELKDIPIIAITASALKQDEAIISKICSGYLRKPFSKKELASELIRFIPHTKVLREE